MSISEWIQLSTVIIAAISALASWKTAITSKKATDISLKMYQEQKMDYDNSFMPVFKVETIQVSSDIVRLRLYNMNDKSISTSNFATTEFIKSFEKTETEKNLISMKFLGEFKESDQIKVWIYYTTLNHKYYSSEINFRIVEGKIVIENIKTKDRN